MCAYSMLRVSVCFKAINARGSLLPLSTQSQILHWNLQLHLLSAKMWTHFFSVLLMWGFLKFHFIITINFSLPMPAENISFTYIVFYFHSSFRPCKYFWVGTINQKTKRQEALLLLSTRSEFNFSQLQPKKIGSLTFNSPFFEISSNQQKKLVFSWILQIVFLWKIVLLIGNYVEFHLWFIYHTLIASFCFLICFLILIILTHLNTSQFYHQCIN